MCKIKINIILIESWKFLFGLSGFWCESVRGDLGGHESFQGKRVTNFTEASFITSFLEYKSLVRKFSNTTHSNLLIAWLKIVYQLSSIVLPLPLLLLFVMYRYVEKHIINVFETTYRLYMGLVIFIYYYHSFTTTL